MERSVLNRSLQSIRLVYAARPAINRRPEIRAADLSLGGTAGVYYFAIGVITRG
jgi:hypothetical protein